ncbi:MAG: barstar family protein [Verrucomicrobia bacterium]|nr:barstar family protein [Verrucomicrobiota bacterium]
MKKFIYFKDPKEIGKYDITVEIKSGIKEKKDLLNAISLGLFFPDYFGGNWDALFDCLIDLSWLSDERILLKHGDVPMNSNVENQRIYLGILMEVTNNWKSGERIEIQAAFPENCRGMIERILTRK